MKQEIIDTGYKQKIIDSGHYTGKDLMRIQACEDDPKKLFQLLIEIKNEQ